MALKLYGYIFFGIALAGASHWVRSGWEMWQENKLDEIRIAELLADKDRELALKDLQLTIAEDSNATLVAENKWAKQNIPIYRSKQNTQDQCLKFLQNH
jgi:hypothetical protein